MNNCKNCGKETKNALFCSKSCSNSYNNSVAPKRQRTNKCKTCSTPILSNVSYCKPCWEDKITPKDITLQEAIYQQHHKSSAFALVRSRARAQAKPKGKPCALCGYDTHVEVCHIKGITSFPEDTLLSEVNHPDNLVLLCRNCHWEVDHGITKLQL